MIILGIDPGTAALGYGLVERTGPRLRAIDYGVITTSSRLPLPERLEAIYVAVTDLIELHAPAIVGVERLFFTRNAQTAFAVGQARGVVLALPICSASPATKALLLFRSRVKVL